MKKVISSEKLRQIASDSRALAYERRIAREELAKRGEPILTNNQKAGRI